MVRKGFQALSDPYPYTFSDDEMGYIAIHLAAALERTKQPLKTILVCHEGSGTSNLLMRKLTAQLPEIEIIAQEHFLGIGQSDLSQADLIITTIELNLTADIPVLSITSLVHDYDILRLKGIVKQYYKAKNTPIKDINVDELPQ